MSRSHSIALAAVGFLSLLSLETARGQSFGVELHNTMMPASAGMAGASLSQPQDLQSAINGNPATLSQFTGTQFSFGGGWAEGTYNVNQTAPLPLVGVDPYSAKSGTPGGLLGNIGVVQDLSMMGIPATTGMAFVTNAGAGVDFRDVPESSGTSAQYIAFDMIMATGMALGERLSLGAAMTLGNSFLDGPFVDSGGMTPAYALRGTVGSNFQINCDTSLGAYWQSQKEFTFEDAAVFSGGGVFDVKLAHPENIGIGLANRSLMNGRLLLASDVLLKRYSNASFFKAIYNDQWVWQLGAQYSVSSRAKLRLGYAYNENPMRQDPIITSIGGVPLPDGVPALRYIQGQFAAVCQHRLTGGIGIRDIMPGIDVDFFAGGMFKNSDQFATTEANVESYWVGFGTTWRFGGSNCDPCPAQ